MKDIQAAMRAFESHAITCDICGQANARLCAAGLKLLNSFYEAIASEQTLQKDLHDVD